MIEENNKLIAEGDKVRFSYYDYDECKYVSGRGWVTDINIEDNYMLIQTTRKLHWVDIDGVHALNTTTNNH